MSQGRVIHVRERMQNLNLIAAPVNSEKLLSLLIPLLFDNETTRSGPTKRPGFVCLLVLPLVLSLTGCGGDQGTPKEKTAPAKLVHPDEGDIYRIVLTPKAEQRLQISTAPVQKRSPADSDGGWIDRDTRWSHGAGYRAVDREAAESARCGTACRGRKRDGATDSVSAATDACS